MNTVMIFDFDGVLADSLEPMLAYAKRVCLEMGNNYDPSLADLEALDRMEFSEFGRQLGIADEKIDEFVSRNFDLFTQRQKPLKIISGMDTVVRELSQMANLGIVTGNSCIVVNKFLEAYGLAPDFKTILCAEDDGSRVEKIQQVVSLYGGSHGGACMIGDAVSDIRAARAAGIASISVAWGHQSKDKLIAEGPDYWVDQPEDLLSLYSDPAQMKVNS